MDLVGCEKPVVDWASPAKHESFRFNYDHFCSNHRSGISACIQTLTGSRQTC